MEKKGDSPSSSSSDAHNEPHEDNGDHDNHTNEHDAQSDCDDQSEGTMLKRYMMCITKLSCGTKISIGSDEVLWSCIISQLKFIYDLFPLAFL